MTFVDEILDRIPQRPMHLVTVQCVTVTPFTVYLNGDATNAVPARRQAGSTFAASDTGMAYWSPPSLPICFKTT